MCTSASKRVLKRAARASMASLKRGRGGGGCSRPGPRRRPGRSLPARTPLKQPYARQSQPSTKHLSSTAAEPRKRPWRVQARGFPHPRPVGPGPVVGRTASLAGRHPVLRRVSVARILHTTPCATRSTADWTTSRSPARRASHPRPDPGRLRWLAGTTRPPAAIGSPRWSRYWQTQSGLLPGGRPADFRHATGGSASPHGQSSGCRIRPRKSRGRGGAWGAGTCSSLQAGAEGGSSPARPG